MTSHPQNRLRKHVGQRDSMERDKAHMSDSLNFLSYESTRMIISAGLARLQLARQGDGGFDDIAKSTVRSFFYSTPVIEGRCMFPDVVCSQGATGLMGVGTFYDGANPPVRRRPRRAEDCANFPSPAKAMDTLKLTSPPGENSISRRPLRRGCRAGVVVVFRSHETSVVPEHGQRSHHAQFNQ